MTNTTLAVAFNLLEQAMELLADVVCDDQGVSVECHTLSERIEEFFDTHEITP